MSEFSHVEWHASTRRRGKHDREQSAHLLLKVRGRPLLELLHVCVEVNQVQAPKSLGEEALRDAQLVHQPSCSRPATEGGRGEETRVRERQLVRCP